MVLIGLRPLPSACALGMQAVFGGSKRECCPEGNMVTDNWSRLKAQDVLWRAAAQ